MIAKPRMTASESGLLVLRQLRESGGQPRISGLRANVRGAHAAETASDGPANYRQVTQKGTHYGTQQ
jgi:hypothetical protein